MALVATDKPASTNAAEKKKLLGVKLDPSIKEKVQRRCAGLGCNFSDYVRDLIKRDIDKPDDSKPTPKGKLVELDTSKEVVQGRPRPTYHIDATGPISRITAMVIDGRTYKYCEKCKKYYRKNPSGKVVFLESL